MYLSIDYGKKRIGLAVGSRFPRGIGTIDNPGSIQELTDKLLIICRGHAVDGVVMGLPMSQLSEKSEVVKDIEELAEKIEKQSGLKVFFEEEDFTSVEAERELISRGVDTRREKAKTDELAAILILEQFIESRSAKS
ncbi:MAG: putative Holliday junction resolvase [bacterium ADurb.Bin212]|jgi:putative Holliday junction resolvase|nr:MAG: putative Holliday junction resolvase [bacterium ADurb.Bin212]